MHRFTATLFPLIAMMGLEAAPTAASANPDTVIGVSARPYRAESMDWTPERFVRIRNLKPGPITVHPPIMEKVFRQVTGGGAGAYPYDCVYAVRRYAGGIPRIDEQPWGGTPNTLAAGDSLDFGMFLIGSIAIPKRSAAAPLQAQLGDTVVVPVTIKYGSDSLKFILKTKIAETVIGGPPPVFSLFGDRDTVLGVNPAYWDPKQEWKRANYIRVRNWSPRVLTLDSIRFPGDSVVQGTRVRPLDRLFAVRTYAGGARTTPIWGGSLKQNPIKLAFGDSADFGLFEIGIINYLVKESAAARRYRVGDTLKGPVTIYAGTDSLIFTLKAIVAEALTGTAIAPARLGAAEAGLGNLSVTADGRAVPERGRAGGFLFRVPAAGTASRPR